LITSQTLEAKKIFRGNAPTWLQDAHSAGFVVGEAPQEGAIAVWVWRDRHGRELGHVAFVELVNEDGSYLVSESNFRPIKDCYVVINKETKLHEKPDARSRIVWNMPVPPSRVTVMKVVGGPVSANNYRWYKLEGNGYEGWAAWVNWDDGKPADPNKYYWNFSRISLEPSKPLCRRTPYFIYLSNFDFSVATSSSSVTVVRPTSGTVTASIVVEAKKTTGLKTVVNFSIAGLPNGVTANPAKWTWALDEQSRTVTFNIDPRAPIGTHTITIIGTITTYTPQRKSVPIKKEAVLTLNITELKISPPTRNFGPEGGTGQMNVEAGDNVAWTAESTVPWIQIVSGTPGTGKGVVTYTVTPNCASRNSRSGTIKVRDQIHRVTQQGDTMNPSAPSNLTARSTFEGFDTVVDLSWQPSRDNCCLSKYQIYRDGKLLAEVSANCFTFRDKTVKIGGVYLYRIYALDAAGNRSAPSNEVRIRALPWPGVNVAKLEKEAHPI